MKSLNVIYIGDDEQSKEFYAGIIEKLIKKWDKYINVNGEYVEK